MTKAHGSRAFGDCGTSGVFYGISLSTEIIMNTA